MADHLPATTPEFARANAALTVMVVDDAPFVRRTVVYILRKLGFQRVVEAENGTQAAEYCIAHAFDLIVCDINMAPMNGLDFLKKMRVDKSFKRADTPVIFLTQETEKDIVKQAGALGVDAFIVKPPSVTALEQRINHILRRI
jgi:two-component system chemotaxis response regulator CheY